jgi:hypothetical protein
MTQHAPGLLGKLANKVRANNMAKLVGAASSGSNSWVGLVWLGLVLLGAST